MKGIRVGAALGITLVAAAFAPAAASAAELYVDDSGNDTSNACTVPANPCLTIQHAVSQAGADTVHVGGGSYTEAVTLSEGETVTEDSSFSGAAAGEAILTSPSGQTAVTFAAAAPAATVRNMTVRSNFRSVDFDSAGTLYGVFDFFPPTPRSDLVRIDASTGAVTSIGTISGSGLDDNEIETLAIAPATCAGPQPGTTAQAIVPANTPWGLALLGVVLALFGLTRVRRQAQR